MIAVYSRWQTLEVDQSIDAVVKPSIGVTGQAEGHMSGNPTLQELVDKSFQIKQSSQTSSWH